MSQEQWDRRPVAQRGETPKLEQEWRATNDPNSEVVSGEMRSDREEIPAGFTKADADKAETMEAALTGNEGAVRALAAPGCQVYWPAPYEVCGEIRDKYNALGGPNSFLLFPKTNELTNPDGIGKRTEFLNGPIYWSPQGGAHPVVNHFLAAWARHGYENSYIGYPTTDELSNPDGIGKRQHFTGSTIYWQLNEAYSIGGAIADKWHTLGAERADGLLGYPTSDEKRLPDGVGRMNRFKRGVIYWHPTTGAHPITGDILRQWEAQGFERGSLGYPLDAASATPDGLLISQNFQGGDLTAYGDIINEIAATMLGNEDEDLTARQVYEDGIAYIAEFGGEPEDVFSSALYELRHFLASPSAPTTRSDTADAVPYAGLPDGQDTDAVNPRNRGDIFYSDSPTAGYNHGHNGIFVGSPSDNSNRRNDTIEASGHLSLSSSSGGDTAAGVKRKENWTNQDPARTHPPRLRNILKMSVSVSQSERDSAANWAVSKSGVGYDNPDAEYNYNFAFNRKDGGKYNCSQLIWAAYMDSTSGRVDIDSNGGPGIYPNQMIDSEYTVVY